LVYLGACGRPTAQPRPIESSPSVEEFDAYLERFAGMAQQPVVMH
jgi:hypothetical protein